MKRLWVRLSAVAAVVSSLGAGGYYLATSGSAADEAAGPAPTVAKNDNPAQGAPITPLKDPVRGGSPAFDGSPSTDVGGGVPTEPAQANWRDQPGQPIIRQVSSNENEGGYDDANYQVGDAPAADPLKAPVASPAYGGGGYDAAPAYDTSDSTPGYGVADARPPIAQTPNYPSTGAAAAAAAAGAAAGAALGAVADTYGAETPDYGTTQQDIEPVVPRQDFSQPVTAPSFANGDPVHSGGATTGDYGAPPVVGQTETAPVAAPTFDASPAPRFDTSGSPVTNVVGQQQAAPVYAQQPTAQQPTARPAYSQPPAVASSAGLVAATPGDRSLDGRQSPSISVEKTVSSEIQVGKPAAFKTLLRNVGKAAAKNVVVTDRVPQGTQLVDATPQPREAADGSLVWRFESLSPGEEVLISMEVMPQVEGEIGNNALVTFQAQASVRTICTKPQLLVEHTTDPKVLIGENVVFNITVSNPGSGDATGIVVEEDVPRGLSHVAGSELELEIGTLRPGESRRLELVLKASEAGVVSNKLRVRGDANLLAEHSTQLEVIAPKLLVGMAGPRRRYLDREVKYQVAFGNAGTAIAKNVELTAYLPKGLQFISTSGKGQYDARDHAVYWSLDQLAPNQEGALELVAVPIAVGDQKLRIEGTADLGLSHENEHTTVVEAITELVFTISDTQDPIEVGSETTYEIRVTNNGSKTATNVQVAAFLPAELTPLSGEGTTRVAVQDQQVVMEPIERMGPRDEAVYKIKVRGQRAGDHIIDVRLVSDGVPTPVTKQESTKVYADGL